MSGLSSFFLRLTAAELVCAASLCLPERAPAPQEQQPPPIRVRVELVNVGVTVTDAAGKFVEGLAKENFHVFDDGSEQPITNFAPIEAPAQVLLLIEAGPAVYLLEREHLQAAYALLSGLAPDDRVAVASYADAAQGVLDFTTDKRVAASALDGLRFNLGMGQLNLAAALETSVAWLETRPGKKAVVLLSTGVDTSGPARWQRLIERLRTSDVTVLAVALAGELREPSPAKKKKSDTGALAAGNFEEADRALRDIAEASGGRAYFPKNAKEFAAIYAQAADLLRHQYSLAFAPASRDGRVHRIEVRVDAPAATTASPKGAPALRLSHRQAYFVPAGAKN
jgi:Ca-activated chloride channel family protein